MEVHRRLLNQSTTYQERRAQIENRALAYEQGARSVARTGVVTIPVVVHVVHAQPAQDISIAQIDSQIDVLNQDFRKANPDVDGVPPVWKALVADCRVEFRLADLDPEGRPTNGITRTPSPVPFFSTSGDDVKSSATGGADPWPSDDYLNIWVCNELRDVRGRSILGYAQFPGGPPSTDGVVIINSCFGTTGTASPPFDLGRTATHEIGHWLDLRHVWGDDLGSCAGSDQVDDTPNQAGPTFGTPTFPQLSCSNGPDGNMFVNYMDYTDDAGMFMFTLGQSRRMDAALEGPRASFLIAPAATAPISPTAAATPAAPGRADGEVQELRQEVARLTSVLDRVRAAVGGGPGGRAGG
jgi:hypothetical protein